MFVFNIIVYLCSVTQSCLTLCDSLGCRPPGSSVHGILQAQILEWVVMPSPRGIFPTQGSNPGLLNCRWILHCLSRQGGPYLQKTKSYKKNGQNTNQTTAPNFKKIGWGRAEKRREEKVITYNQMFSLALALFIHDIPTHYNQHLRICHIPTIKHSSLNRFFISDLCSI